LRIAIERIRTDDPTARSLHERFDFLRSDSPLLLVTHRERIAGFAQLGRALRKVARARPDVDIVYPIALTPDAQRDTQLLGWRPANVWSSRWITGIRMAPAAAHLVLTGSRKWKSAALLGKPVWCCATQACRWMRRTSPAGSGRRAIAKGVMTLLGDPIACKPCVRSVPAARSMAKRVCPARIVDALAAVPRSSALAA
jgi:UDP-N-acetylglucosamine 2-epimerase (non-hydrolysing)